MFFKIPDFIHLCQNNWLNTDIYHAKLYHMSLDKVVDKYQAGIVCQAENCVKSPS